MKKILIAFLLAIALVACSNDSNDKEKEVNESQEEEQEANESKEDAESEDPETEVEDEASNEADEQDSEEGEEMSWDDLKTIENIVGKSDKNYSEVSKSKPSEVRNDVTGNWRKVTLAEDIDIVEYAKSYNELHMDEGETHFIINFNKQTTTVINKFTSLIYVDIREYVKKEEHDAKQLGSGMELVNYVIYPDGDIEKLEE